MTVLFSLNAQVDDCGGATYEEVNNLVIIEAENLNYTGTDWSLKTDFPGYTGVGYLSWDGPTYYNTPGEGLLTTTIQINTPGTYRFRWHSKVGNGNSSTDHNDSWLRFPDASDFYGEQNGARIYPNDTGQSPNPVGASSDGWFKIYISGTTDWTWSTNTSDHDAHDIYVEFDTAGVYTMEISGRSTDHLIDRITLSNNATDPLDLDNTETPCPSTLSIDELDPNDIKTTMRLYPNPSSQYIHIAVTGNNSYEINTVNIFDMRGLKIDKVQFSNNTLDVSQLSAGLYILVTDSGETARFIKE